MDRLHSVKKMASFVFAVSLGLSMLISPSAAEESPVWDSGASNEGDFNVSGLRKEREKIVKKGPPKHKRPDDPTVPETDGVIGPRYKYRDTRNGGCDEYLIGDNPQNPFWCNFAHAICLAVEHATGDEHRNYVRRKIDSSGNPIGNPERTGCAPVNAGSSSSSGGQPVVVVDQKAFESLNVKPLKAQLGPPRPYIVTDVWNIVYARAEVQELTTTMLGQQVRIRATPVEYRWDFGDGNTITTTFPGRAFPNGQIASKYRYEGWYEMKLETGFEGEYSVEGGPWLPIEGQIVVPSEPRWVYADMLVPRLGPGDDLPPISERTGPERTKENLGKQDPDAEHLDIKKPMKIEFNTN